VAEAAAAASTAADATLEGADRATRPDRVSSVLVAVGPGPHSGATVDVARRLRTRPTRGSNSSTSSPRTPRLRTGRRGRTEATPRTISRPQSPETASVTTTPQPVSDCSTLLATASVGSTESIAGSSRTGRPRVRSSNSPLLRPRGRRRPTTGTVGRFVFGSTTDTVVDDAEVPVVVVEADGSTALNAE